MIYIRLCCIIAMLLLADRLCAQTQPIVSPAALSEKIYLQLTDDVYTGLDTLWFNAFIVASSDRHPSLLTGVLHVDLIDVNEQILESKRIPIREGTGSGHFALSSDYPAGIYQVRAYSQWNLNFGQRFFAERYIHIVQAESSHRTSPILHVMVSEDEAQKHFLSAQFLPNLIDQKHEGDLSVLVTWDDHTDSLRIKRARNGEYRLHQLLPEDAQSARIRIQTNNQVYSTRSVLLHPDSLLIHFYPEGGTLLQGVATSMAFRAVDRLGRGIPISGHLVDDSGQSVLSIQSNAFGIGHFSWKADWTAGMSLRVDQATTTLPRATSYALPQPEDTGITLSATADSQQVKLRVNTAHLDQDTVTILVSSSGVLYYTITGILRSGQLETTLPLDNLPEGIVQFAIQDPQQNILTQRLLFCRQIDEVLHFEVAGLDSAYRTRQKATISVRSHPPTDTLSTLHTTVHAVQADRMRDSDIPYRKENVVSYMMLSSEFDEPITAAAYYLQNEKQTELDALLMTLAPHYHYAPESYEFAHHNVLQPYISGTVRHVSSRKPRADIDITLMTFGQSQWVDQQKTDSIGRFYFPLGEQYGNTVPFILQTTNQKGKNRDYHIDIDPLPVPDVRFRTDKVLELPDSIQRYRIQQKQQLAHEQHGIQLANEGIRIATVDVFGRQLSPQQQAVTDRYGSPETVIDGEDIEAKEQKWSYGLYSVLQFYFPQEVRIVRSGANGGTVRATLFNSNATLVVVDGISVHHEMYDLIPIIAPSEVKSLEIIPFAKNFSQLYRDTYPQASPLEIPMMGNVIAIYTHAGKGIFSADRAVGITKGTAPVYSDPISFQQVQHGSTTDDARDLRQLLYWSPPRRLSTRQDDKSTYFHSDQAGQFVLIIEGISSDGRASYLEIPYRVMDTR